ncbi:hypothetical protein ACIA74_22215 [Streptomyces sp. NPDC051658]|uniref:hypothetical protein n=1 Tax=Streptomyces sp. NPDC051658 TaxID=3365667 RepID=UPI0037BC643D
MSGRLKSDLLVVPGCQVRVLPREHGGDERFVPGAVQGEFGFDQAVGALERGVGAAHLRLAVSSWSPMLSSGAWVVWARKRA